MHIVIIRWFFMVLLELFFSVKETMCMFERECVKKCVSFAGMLFNLIINIIIFLVLKGIVRVFSDL